MRLRNSYIVFFLAFLVVIAFSGHPLLQEKVVTAEGIAAVTGDDPASMRALLRAVDRQLKRDEPDEPLATFEQGTQKYPGNESRRQGAGTRA